MLTIATVLAAVKGAGIPVSKGVAGAAASTATKSIAAHVFGTQARREDEAVARVVAMAVIRSIEDARDAHTPADEAWWSRAGRRLIKPFVGKSVAPYVVNQLITEPANDAAVQQILAEALLRSGSDIEALAESLSFSADRFMAVIVPNLLDEFYTASAESASPLLARAQLASSREVVALLAGTGPGTETISLTREVGSLTDDDAVKLLGIRPAAGATDVPDTSALPPYLLRDIDTLLRTRLREISLGHRGAVIVLSGDSGTGKSRAAWETIKFALPDWRIWFDLVPGYSSSTFNERVAAGLAPDRTVLWLNDAQNYLEPAVEGGQLAGAIIEWINRPGPRLVVATIWPEPLRRLTDDTSVRHAAANKLLSGNVIAVPDSFTDQELQRAENHQLIQSDSRLRNAVGRGNHGRVAQTLSGVYAIRHQYADSNPAERAILWAATDAHRLSSRWRSIPARFLHDAAPGYLTDTQWQEAQPWSAVFEKAIDRLTTRVCGSGGLLDRHIPRPNSKQDNGYQLTDVLEQELRGTRFTEFPPAEFWDAAASIIGSLDSNIAFELGASAICRGRFRRGYQQFIVPAAQRDNPNALEWLAHRHLDDYDSAGAVAIMSAAVKAGATSDAWVRLALRVVCTDTPLSVDLAIRAARAGNTDAGEGIARFFADRQDWPTAIDVGLLLNPFDAGEALALVAILMAVDGEQLKYAEELARRITDRRKSLAILQLINETMPLGPPNKELVHELPVDELNAIYGLRRRDDVGGYFIDHRTGELIRTPKLDYNVPHVDLTVPEGWVVAEERALADLERGDTQPLFYQ